VATDMVFEWLVVSGWWLEFPSWILATGH